MGIIFDGSRDGYRACIWEVTARKIGNVHRYADFTNLLTRTSFSQPESCGSRSGGLTDAGLAAATSHWGIQLWLRSMPLTKVPGPIPISGLFCY
jgi:hypothetical protein